jgi:hypothetical protein
LRIVGIQDIGPMGPKQGEPTFYYWPVYAHASRLFPLLLLMFLLARRPNRNRGAWWILPALALPLLFNFGLERTGVTQYIPHVHDSYAILIIAMTLLWLMADKLTDLTRKRALMNAVILFVLAGIIGLFSFSSLSMDGTAMAYGAFAIAALATIILPGVMCRKHYSPKRFLLWYIIIALPIGAAFAALVAALVTFLPPLFTGDSISMGFVRFHLSSTILPAALGSGALSIAVAPFIALALWVPVYRRGFHAIFRLPGMDFGQDEAYNEEVIGEHE